MVTTHRALSNEEKNIHALLARLSASVEASLKHATEAFLQGDRDIAEQVIEDDEHINRLYYQVEEQCFVSIALRQPVANDLRDLLSSMHIAAELERIGDYAADIARTTLQMELPLGEEIRARFEDLSVHCLKMLGSIMSIYQRKDVSAAKTLAGEEEIVDAAELEIRAIVVGQMNAQSVGIENGMHAICVAHKFERTADRVTNIAERVVFAASGDVVELD